MNEIFILCLSLSFSGAVTALLIFLLRPLTKKNFSKTWHYYIWVVVILRLLIPVSPEVNLVSSLFERTEEAVLSSISPGADVPDTIMSFQELVPAADGEIKEQGEYEPEGASVVPQGGHDKADVHLELNLMNAVAFAGYIWLVTACVLLIRKIRKYVQMVIWIKSDAVAPASDYMYEVMNWLCMELRISKQPNVLINSRVKAPMLIGTFRQYIVLPDEVEGQEQLKFILLHELSHYKRGDIYYKWLMQAAVCVHWFNPVVYAVQRKMYQYCELSCDETVVNRIRVQERRLYGEAILSAIRPGGQSNYANMVNRLSEDAKMIKERLEAIMIYKKKRNYIRLASIALAVMLTCCAMFSGAYAADGKSVQLVKKDEFTNKGTYDPYIKFGLIAISDGSGKEVLFYENQRVRLLIDQREDSSFNLCFVDETGTSDLIAVRNPQGNLIGLNPMSSVQSKEWLASLELDDRNAEGNREVYSDVSGRLSLSQMPSDLSSWIDDCNTGKGLFIATYNEQYYIYCNSIPGEFAWKPTFGENTKVEIYDLGSEGDGYALLTIPLCQKLTVIYNDAVKTVTKSTASDDDRS